MTENGNISRRGVLGAVWATPVILAATAAPAVAASAPPPVISCVDPTGLQVLPVDGQPWKTNQGQGYTLVDGDSIMVANEGPYNPIRVAVTVWTSAHQEGLKLVGQNGTTIVTVPKDGNRATVQVAVDDAIILKVTAPSKNAEAHVIIGCDKGFILKSSR